MVNLKWLYSCIKQNTLYLYFFIYNSRCFIIIFKFIPIINFNTILNVRKDVESVKLYVGLSSHYFLFLIPSKTSEAKTTTKVCFVLALLIMCPSWKVWSNVTKKKLYEKHRVFLCISEPVALTRKHFRCIGTPSWLNCMEYKANLTMFIMTAFIKEK